MVTRYGPSTKVLKYHENSSGNHVLHATGRLINALSILDNVRIVPSAVESFSRKVRLCDFKDMQEEGLEKGGLPRITVRESLVPDRRIFRPSGSQMLKSPAITPCERLTIDQRVEVLSRSAQGIYPRPHGR